MPDVRDTQIIILGASGDLTARKLVPAIYNGWRAGGFKGGIQVVGVARRPWDDAGFRAHLQALVELGNLGGAEGATQWPEFLGRISYVQTELDQPASFAALRQRLDALVPAGGSVNRVFYLAVKPELFLATVDGMHGAGLVDEGPGRSVRVVVEKPFGYDLQSAQALNQHLLRNLTEKQLYRIDHYLGKETVQNILALRFRNAMFEPIWNSRHVELVQLTVAEEVIVGDRGGYYDGSGAIRDIVQNHLLQILALVAMEPPSSLAADAVRDEKVKALASLRLPTAMGEPGRHVVRGQYEGYLQEKGVAAGSTTETYIACRTYIDNWRWGGVPFLIRTGKGLPARFTSVAVQFRMPPHSLFGSWSECHLRPNHLTLRIQPREGIDLGFDVKEPGSGLTMRPAKLSFDYQSFFSRPTPEAYQRLLQDVVSGDQSLFIRSDEVEACWRWADSLRDLLQDQPVHAYAKKSWGPAAADGLFGECEGRWVRE